MPNPRSTGPFPILVTFAAVGAIGAVAACDTGRVIPATVGCAGVPQSNGAGLSVDRAGLIERIDEVFALAGPDGPGTSVIVLHDNGVIAERQFGLASLELEIPFTSRHVVRLPYSEAREFIAVTAVFMQNDGILRLDDGVREYFPQLPEWSDPVTIRSLLFHRSGFIDEWSAVLLMHASMENRFDVPQFLRLLEEQPAPEVEPGVGYMYSNSDYGLLRLIMEKAASESLDAYMDRRVFEPLGMRSSRLGGTDDEVVENHVPLYGPDGDRYKHAYVKTSPGADYAIMTSACDLAAWAVASSDPSSEVSEALSTLLDGARELPGKDGHFAIGRTLTTVAGTDVVLHEGVNEALYLSRIPSLGFSVITFSNRYYDPAENRAILEFLLGVESERNWTRFPTERVDVEDLSRLEGWFVVSDQPSWESHVMARDEIRILHENGTLTLDWPEWDRFELVPVGPNTFSWHEGAGERDFGMLLEFSDPSRGAPLELVVSYNDGYPSESFLRLDEWKPADALLRSAVGTYHSAHLDYSWRIEADDSGQLTLRAPTIADIPLEPYQEDEFLLRHEKLPGVPERIWIRFHEGVDGEITHLTAWHPRLMNHRFDRR